MPKNQSFMTVIFIQGKRFPSFIAETEKFPICFSSRKRSAQDISRKLHGAHIYDKTILCYLVVLKKKKHCETNCCFTKVLLKTEVTEIARKKMGS